MLAFVGDDRDTSGRGRQWRPTYLCTAPIRAAGSGRMWPTGCAPPGIGSTPRALTAAPSARAQVRPGITTESQADEIAQLLFYEDLKDVVLVGTSSGGMVVCRVAELMRDRVGRLVFVDALALLAGEKIRDIVTRSTATPSGGGLTAGPRARTRRTGCSPISSRRPRLGARALYAAPDRHLRPTGKARSVLATAVEGQRHLVHAGAEPRRGASAPLRRKARRQLRDARHRPLPDAEHAGRADPVAARRLIRAA